MKKINAKICFFEKGFYRLYLESEKIKNKIAAWKGCKKIKSYSCTGKVLGWGVVFPARFYNRVAKLTGLELVA